MVPRKFFESLSKANGPFVTELPRLPIKLGVSDIWAAKLLLWLEDNMPDDVTVGDYSDVLDSASWWVTYFSSCCLVEDESDGHGKE